MKIAIRHLCIHASHAVESWIEEGVFTLRPSRRRTFLVLRPACDSHPHPSPLTRPEPKVSSPRPNHD